MRAWVCRQPGIPSDALALESAWPVPALKEGEVLVKVHSAALNWGSYRFMAFWPLNTLTKRPSIPQSDFAGVVVDSRDGAFEAGARVCGYVLVDV